MAWLDHHGPGILAFGRHLISMPLRSYAANVPQEGEVRQSVTHVTATAPEQPAAWGCCTPNSLAKDSNSVTAAPSLHPLIEWAVSNNKPWCGRGERVASAARYSWASRNHGTASPALSSSMLYPLAVGGEWKPRPTGPRRHVAESEDSGRPLGPTVGRFRRSGGHPSCQAFRGPSCA